MGRDTHQGANEDSVRNTTATRGGYTMEGRLIGAGANEPGWTEEELIMFSERHSFKPKIVSMSGSRKSVQDKLGR